MGLLEKALRYKKDINRMGKETLIDRIKGPAETAMLHDRTEEELREGKESIGKERSDAGVLYEDGDIESVPRNSSSSGMDVSPDGDDEIFTLSEEDLKEAFEEEHVDSDDGIFHLPDMDDGSPLDTLESQKGVALSEQVEVEDSSVRERVGGDDDLEESDRFVSKGKEPLGPDDEPILPVKGEMTPVGEKGAGVDEGGSEVERGARANGKRRSEVLHPPRGRDVLKRSERKFQDFFVLYEIGKDIFKAESERDLFNVILFSVMGQIGAASSSIMVPSTDDESKWFIVDSRGVTVDNPMLYFSTEDGIMKGFLERREIVDIEQYKNIPEYRDEYYKFISVDGRLLSPLNYNDSVIGALILGDKITVGDYSEEERDFINSVCEISAVALRRINGIEDLKKNRERYRTELDDISEIESLSRRLIESASLSGINEIINDTFKGMGISAYSIFMSSEKYNEFIPLFVEDEDFLTLRESNFSVKYNSAFIRYILDLSKEVRIGDFSRVREINEAFNEKLLRRMTHFWIYPFRIGADLIGFLAVFRVDKAEIEDEVYKKLSRFSKILFPCILSVQRFDTQENRYIDSMEVILRRAEKQLDNARDLKIPLTIILFSIKNFKRYYSLYGYGDARRLVESIEGVIKGRLSTHDFSARIDRNKVLVILPGNNKKYAVPLANAIKNEILHGFKKKEMQLLITFLTAEYPADGEDLYSLLDSID